MFKLPKSMLRNMFNVKLNKSYYFGVYSGSEPTKEDLSSAMTNRVDGRLCPADLYQLVNSNGREVIADMITWNLTVEYREAGNLIHIPFARNVAPFTIREEGVPTFFVLFCTEDNDVSDGIENRNDTVVPFLAIGSVGQIGDGTDMELLTGKVLIGPTYSVSDIDILLP